MRWILIALLSLGVIGCNSSNLVTVWVPSEPFSADPIESNYIVHQILYRSVLSTLVSKHRVGRYSKLLVEKWSVSSDFREWSFTPRRDALFENGHKVSGAAIVASLTRLAFVARSGKRRLAMFDKMTGISQLKSPNAIIPGLTVDKNGDVILKFDAPIPSLLEILSESQYAIVHQENFDPVSGAWIASKKPISSGPYSLELGRPYGFKLIRRKDFSLEGSAEKPISEIEITWKPERREKSDILLGHSTSEVPLGYEFTGGPVAGIGYVRCHSWKRRDRVCGDRHDRIILRDAFYNSLRRSGLDPVFSFFPNSRPKESILAMEQGGFQSHREVLFFPSKSKLNRFFIKYGDALVDACRIIGCSAKANEISVKEVVAENAPDLQFYSVDLSVRATEMDLGNIRQELYAMFIDPAGLRLPDPDGRIAAHIRSGKSNLDQLNEIIWEEGAIWPLVHFSQGFLAKRGRIDFSLINPMATPMEFAWVGMR